MRKAMIVVTTLISFTFPATVMYASQKTNGMTEDDFQQLQMFGKILESRHNYTNLSAFEAEHTKGKTPVVIVAIAAGAVAGGIDAIWQYSANGQINYWQVAATSSGAFFGTLTGGLVPPAAGTTTAILTGTAAGGIATNVTGMLENNGIAIATQMSGLAMDLACKGCH